ncbi:hypothetical protein, partial [Kineococcus glutinatus]|uniref:hypothetical protein n=1 Tax=Kineococcus glutinatus TaxID=1070872 RepID=UPI0031F16652
MAATPTGSGDRTGAGALTVIGRHRWRLLAAALLFGVVGGGVSAVAVDPRYTATAAITLSTDRPYDPQGRDGQLGDPTKWATVQSGIAQSRAVFDLAAQTVPAAEQATFRDSTEIVANNDLNQITVTATASTAADAVAVADAVATSYREVRADDVRTKTAQALAQVTDEATRQQITLASTSYGDGVAVLDNATLPTAPSSPSPLLVGLLSALAGLLLAAALVVWRAHVRQRISTPPLEGVAELGRWTAPPSPQELADPAGAAAQSAGVLLVGLQHLGHLRTPRLEVGSVLVTAASGDASAVAVGLAAAAARSGRRVVLVEADERGGRLASLGAPVLPASGRRSVEVPQPWVVGGTSVEVLSLGAHHLQPRAVGSTLRELVEGGYLVVVVGGSVLDSPAAFAVAGEVDAVLVQ